MIAILPAADEERPALLEQAGLSGPGDCLVASDGRERLGSVVYRVQGKAVEIFSAQAEDARLLDGLLRAALNAALDAGARTAFCAVPALYPALRTLGFRGPENEGASGREPVQAEILDLFSKGCPGGCAGIAGK